MVEFQEWTQAFIFIAIFAPIIILPCVFVTIMGRKMINQLGLFPTQTAITQMGIFWQLVVLQIITFSAFTLFFLFFSAKGK